MFIYFIIYKSNIFLIMVFIKYIKYVNYKKKKNNDKVEINKF